MGLLATASLATTSLLIACYDPEARDCTVTCSANEPCTGDQVCGSDGFCASPAIAGHCGDTADAAVPRVSLQIVVEGGGKVSVTDVGTCYSTCTYDVTANMQLELKAIDGGEREFVEWTETCTGSDKSCVVTPMLPITIVAAKFQ